MKLTAWYPTTTKPVHRGWYERQYPHDITFMDWFDGNRWLYSKCGAKCANQYLHWRGVAK